MGPLKHQTFFSGVFHLPLVLVRFAAEPHIDGVAQVQFVFQHIGNRAVAPVIGLFCVQRGVTDPELLIGIGGGAEDLFLPQLTGDLARPAASGAHGEYPADNGGGFLVHN